ncbi:MULTISPECIES: NADP-dependent oxidoreductase [Sphingomonas]|uniref:NADP-dependent oxidoreductase n=1 Tax=Sphingomonas TaxID=13687 RepID=UPI000DF005FF|nr:MULTISPECIES: NADP-dependent oxidoreductase [Sphingomonas]
MKRIQYSRYGGPEELRLDEVELRAPGRREVRVRVIAASVNPMDWVIRGGNVKSMSGRTFPRGLGHDFAGVIEEVGPEVTRLKVGDEVFGATDLKEAGAFAEALVTDEKNVFIKPPAIPFDVAGALPIVSMTAWTALFDKAKLRTGQSVFITGCLGGVGRAAVQLALRQGAVVAGSCSASGRGEAVGLGVSEIFDYKDFSAEAIGKRFDVLLDTAGALPLRQCEKLLKRGGVALHIVITPAKLIRSLVSSRHKTVFGTATAEGMANIVDAAVHGKLAPKIAQTVPLSEAIPAIINLELTGLPKGKLLVVPDGHRRP